LLRIPTREEQRSMNLGQAVAVCLYELARDAKSSFAPEKPALAAAGDLERLTSLLLDALQAGGYVKSSQGKAKSRSAAAPEEKVRRFIRRMNLSAADAELLLGMLRQILWKLRCGPAT
jgi:tRNA C32,U32 (ribose-2'-O)-methylase TrmJ